MGLFDINKLPSEKEQKLSIPKFQNVDRTMEELSDRLNSVGEISDVDIPVIIFSSYHLFLNDMFLRNEKRRESIISVFTNEKFIQAMIYCVSDNKIVLDGVQLICCNKVCWDAMSTDIKPEIKELLLQLSYKINKTEINMLSLYVNTKIASLISLARHSSFDERKNVRRVNRILVSTKNTNTQTCVNVYSVLFKDCLTVLFEATMFDVETILNETSQFWNHIFLALLAIMENMPSKTIEDVLKSYAQTYSLEGGPKIRFSLNKESFESNYPRIWTVIKQLEINNIIVP